MAENKKNYRIEIIIALIGLFGALGGALIGNWDKVFPQKDSLTDQHLSEKIEPEKIEHSSLVKRIDPSTLQVTRTQRLDKQVINYNAITSTELDSFVLLYLDILSRCNMSEISNLYDDYVDYFGLGRVNKGTIREDKENFCERWPTIRYELEGSIMSQDTNDEKIKLIEFPISFNVYNSKRLASMSGTARNYLMIHKLNGELKIIDEKQKVLRREKH